jgi:hypothetical protein
MSAGRLQLGPNGKLKVRSNGRLALGGSKCCCQGGCKKCNPSGPGEPIRARIIISGAAGCCGVVNGSWDADWSILDTSAIACTGQALTLAASCCTDIAQQPLPLRISFGSTVSSTDPFSASVTCPTPTPIFLYAGTGTGPLAQIDFCQFRQIGPFAMTKQTADPKFVTCPSSITWSLLRLA